MWSTRYSCKVLIKPNFIDRLCFVRVSEQTAIISKYALIGFHKEKESVYCVVRAECYIYFTLISVFKGLR